MGDDLTEADFDAARIEQVREQVRELQRREGLSNAAMARETDIGQSTLAAFLAGSYRGNMAAQALTLQRWLTGRATGAVVRQRVPRAPGYVQTRSSEAFIALLEHTQYTPDFTVLVGTPGVGKTTTAKEYAARGHNVFLITAQPKGGSASQIARVVANAITIPALGFHTHGILADTVVARLTEMRNVLLILDEAQHIRSEGLDQLRMFHDLGDCGVALLGNHSIFRQLEGGVRAADYAQLYSRVGMRLNRQKPYAEDIEALLDAWGITDAAVRKVARAVARRPGALRFMTKVLRQAHLRASAGDGTVTEAMMIAAAKQLGDDKPLDMGDAA